MMGGVLYLVLWFFVIWWNVPSYIAC